MSRHPEIKRTRKARLASRKTTGNEPVETERPVEPRESIGEGEREKGQSVHSVTRIIKEREKERGHQAALKEASVVSSRDDRE